ncbi:MAG: GNAT family N-acetyltransferase [Gemmatimonadales bacterium]
MQVTRTYLELKDREQFKASFGDFPGVTIARAQKPLPALYRMCYQTVGEAFHWRDRWDWTDQQIAAHLADPCHQLFVAMRANGKKKVALAGWYELRQVPEDESVEIAYFGIVSAEFGHGVGKHLLSHAVRDAWALGASRVWLHTCTLDHPNALPNYIARGFTPYRTETYEVD